MTGKESLFVLTKKANDLVVKLVEDIDLTDWRTIPNGQKSSILWQVGHLVISQNFHAIMVITGLRPELKHVPLKLFFENFGMNSVPANVTEELTPELVKTSFLEIGQTAVNSYEQLTGEALNEQLEPTKVPHPFAKVKHEAMMWNIQHIHWHCGQIALLRSAMGLGSVFGKSSN